jgi:hypothetical protein
MAQQRLLHRRQFVHGRRTVWSYPAHGGEPVTLDPAGVRTGRRRLYELGESLFGYNSAGDVQLVVQIKAGTLLLHPLLSVRWDWQKNCSVDF